MSTRDELFESMTPWDRRPAPGEAESVNALLDAYRDEILREAAEKIRREIRNATGNPAYSAAWADAIANGDTLANLIDPEVSNG